MNQEPDKKQSKRLTFKTFKKWPFKKDFSTERYEWKYIMSLVCKVDDSLAHNYPGCLAYIHLANVENNNAGDLFDWSAVSAGKVLFWQQDILPDKKSFMSQSKRILIKWKLLQKLWALLLSGGRNWTWFLA